MDAERTLTNIVSLKETELRPLRHETAAAFNSNGIIALEKSSEPDKPYEIVFTDAEIAGMQAETGVVFTHNHPQGWKYAGDDPRHAGNSFSPEDIELACKAGFAEIRAVSPGYRFSLRPATDRFAANDWQAIDLVFRAEYAAANREMTLEAAQGRLEIAQGRLEIAKLQTELLHEAWRRAALVPGLRYERTEN